MVTLLPLHFSLIEKMLSENEQPDDDSLLFSSLLDHADITIIEAERRANSLLNFRDYFIAYLIETKVKSDDDLDLLSIPQLNLIWRRYSEFEQLRQYLVSQYPYLIVPPLSEKKPMYTWRSGVTYDTTDPDFVDRRRAGLENFIHRTASHPILCRDRILRDFLVKEQGWNVSLKQTGYLHMIETKIKDLAAPVKPSQIVDQFDEILVYSKHLEGSLDSMLKIRAKTTEKLYMVDNLHVHLGRLFSEWSVIEKGMGDGFQKAGHYVDTIPPSTETILQDEDVIADQFKEYLFFTASLEEMYKHKVALCLHINRLRESIASKQHEKQRVLQGKLTLVNRLFGAVQTKEVRDEKIQQLNERINEDEDNIGDVNNILKEFTDLALADFKRFQKQKDQDIQQTLISYVTQQIHLAKKGLTTWTSIKKCIETIP